VMTMRLLPIRLPLLSSRPLARSPGPGSWPQASHRPRPAWALVCNRGPFGRGAAVSDRLPRAPPTELARARPTATASIRRKPLGLNPPPQAPMPHRSSDLFLMRKQFESSPLPPN
jgi:hypothetical protein